MKLKYRKKSTKTGKNFSGGGKNFSGWPEYIPLSEFEKSSIGLELRELLSFFLWLFDETRSLVLNVDKPTENRVR